MPRDANGNYTLPLPPVNNGEVIEADYENTTMADIADEITNSLDRNGRGGMLTGLPFVDGTLAQPAFQFQNDPSTGFHRSESGVMVFGSVGQNMVRMGASGKLEVWDSTNSQWLPVVLSGSDEFVSLLKTARQQMAGPLSSVDPAAYAKDDTVNPRFWLVDENGDVRGQLSWERSTDGVELRLYDASAVLQARMQLRNDALEVDKDLINQGHHYIKAAHATANVYVVAQDENGANNLGGLLLARSEGDLRLRLYDFTDDTVYVDLVLNSDGSVEVPSCELSDIDQPRKLATKEYVDQVLNRQLVDETANRVFDATYTNNTGYEMVVQIIPYTSSSTSSPAQISLEVNGIVVDACFPYIWDADGGVYYPRREGVGAVIPDGATYVLRRATSHMSIETWSELKVV